MNIPITQSDKWQKLQDDLGEISHFEKHDDYQYLAIEKHTKAGKYLFLPYGPVATTEKGFKMALESLTSLGKSISAIFIRIEPRMPSQTQYLPHSAKKVKDIEPAETWVLDLPKDEQDLKPLLPSRLLRYYKNREKQGITIEESHNPDDIKYLLKLQKALADKKGITTFTEKYLKTELQQPFATLYLVRHRRVTVAEGPPRGIYDVGEDSDWQDPSRSEVIAAGLIFDDEATKTRYNLQGAQSEEGRLLHATGILTIQLIKDAQAKNYQTFDFWGIAPEGAGKDHPWYGFTAFKKTFNGREQKYAGTYDIILKPAKYKLFKSLQKLKKIVK